MVILSLFDGMSCGQIALKELGVTIDKYYASEIDKFAADGKSPALMNGHGGQTINALVGGGCKSDD